MSLKNMTKEDIEILSYTDLTFMLLKEKKKPMTTADIFKEICNLLEQGEEYYMNEIGDFYTSLTIDKRFIWLDSKEWDLRDNHHISMIVDDEEDEELEEAEEESEEDEELEEEIDEDLDDLEEDEELDDFDDLNIVTDEELEID